MQIFYFTPKAKRENIALCYQHADACKLASDAGRKMSYCLPSGSWITRKLIKTW